MTNNVVSMKVIVRGLIMLVPAFLISLVFGIGVLIFLGLVFHAAVVYSALQNIHQQKEE